MKLYLLGLVPIFCIFAGVFAQENNGTVVPPELPDTPKGAKWFVNSTSAVCAMFEAGVRFSFEYVNSSDVTKIEEFDLVNDVFKGNTSLGVGTCKEKEDELRIRFYKDHAWNLTLEFNFIDNNKTWELSAMTLDYVLTTGQLPLPDVKLNDTGSFKANLTDHLFNTKQNRSYQCESRQEFRLVRETGGITNANITFRNMQVEAFRTKNDRDFNNPTSCPEDSVSNIVPIAVGAALGALVLIVLIAYLIGRRKSRRGYESV